MVFNKALEAASVSDSAVMLGETGAVRASGTGAVELALTRAGELAVPALLPVVAALAAPAAVVLAAPGVDAADEAVVIFILLGTSAAGAVLLPYIQPTFQNQISTSGHTRRIHRAWWVTRE